MRRASVPLLLLAGLALLVLALFVTLLYGPVVLPLKDALQALLPSGTENEMATLIVQNIRLPRALLAISVGALLALCGAVLQGLFRNPLADPGIIGVSGGAALGAGLAIVLLPLFSPTLSWPTEWLRLGYNALSAFICGMFTTLLVYRIGRSPLGTSMTLILLAGIAISAMAFAGLGLLSYLASDQQLRDLSLWQMGSLAGARWYSVVLASSTALLLLVYFQRQAPALNALLLGESEARHLGIAVEPLKRRLIVSCAMGIGIGVAVAGMIGFVGLVIPHLVRLVCGPDYRHLLPLSALWGAILLLLADVCARLLAPPAEIPIGIITALLGAPFFLWLLLQQKRSLP
ncbi:iron ABC transporter permease [Serratia sp. S1B]|nr:iron ABC transporter permease [Serratia sp. S1B]